MKLYELEKSVDGTRFSSCYALNINGADTTGHFEYIDRRLAPGTGYYRLKITGLNGAIAYSPIKQLMTGLSGDIVRQVYGTHEIVIQCARKDQYVLEVFDTDGKTVYHRQLPMDKQQPVNVQLEGVKSNKMYYYRLSGQLGDKITGLLML